MQRTILRLLISVSLFAVGPMPGRVTAFEQDALPSYQFDMGAEDSPVAEGAVRITPNSTFSEQTGHGWTTKPKQAFDVARPEDSPSWTKPSGQVIPREYLMFKEHNSKTRDGVSGAEPVSFRVKVPNGTYRVAITLGNLEKPICSETISINGDIVATDIDAKHFAQRGGADHQYGCPRTVRRTVKVTDGAIEIRVAGDNRGFMKRFNSEFEKDTPRSYLTGQPGRAQKPDAPDISTWGNSDRTRRGTQQTWAWEDIGGPFTENAINSIEVYPYRPWPIAWENGQLVCNSDDPHAKRGVELFNKAGKEGTGLAKAEKEFDAVQDDCTRAIGYAWLAGHPNYEEELRLVPKSLELLNQLAPSRSGDLMFAEMHEHLRRMDKVLYRFEHRADELRTYNELLLISGETSSMQPDQPCYYKGKMYAGRGYYMIIPHRWAFSAGAGRQIFEELEQAGFGSNRFVQWYLHDNWSPTAPDWNFPDYSEKREGLPAWAADVFEAYNREVNLSEWWIANRQAADGSLGGGWGDDVEILRGFGAFGAICPDASPSTIQGVRNVANGAWNSGSVDTESGYFVQVSDTEHSGEWTADTLTAMMRVDYGNPVYIERAMKTGRLMRDLWMDVNPRGDFLMRSNFLGSRGVGSRVTQNESRINYRPATPARAVIWYNNSPTLQSLFVRWADAWLAASLSTAKGKPRGIIPQEIGFADSELGGTGAPTWYTADRPAGSVNYDWEGVGSYHDFIVDLFLVAYEATGDRKYLEPMELEVAYALEHCPEDILNSDLARQGRVTSDLWNPLPEASPEWIAAHLAAWPRAWEDLRHVMFPEDFSENAELISLNEAGELCARECEGSRARWPHVTTECIATDRVYFPGLGSALRVMTGYGTLGSVPLVTYRGLGRDFAAAVLSANTATLKVALCNVSNEEKDAAISPWLLNIGATYALRFGPDADGDGQMDRATETRRVDFTRRGQEIPIRVAPRQAYVLEIRQEGPAHGKTALLPDVALSEEDVEFVADLSKVVVTVHNVGSQAARQFDVVLYDGEREIGRTRIPNIEPPLQLQPETVRVEFPLKATKAEETLTVAIDEANVVDEITDRNNSVTVTLKTPTALKRQHSSP